MKIQILFIAALVLFATGCKKDVSVGNAEKVLLRLNLQKGFEQKVTYRMSSNENKDVFIDQNVNLTIRLDSIINDGEGFVFSAQLDRIRMIMEMMGTNDYYDSAKKEEDMNAEELSWHNDFKVMLDTPLSFTLSKRGEIVENFKFKENAMPAEDPIDLYNFQIVFPDKPVGVGDTWENERKVTITDKLSSTTKSTYTVKNINDKEIVISMNSIVGGFKGIIKDSNARGEYTIDRETGSLKSSTMEMNNEQMGGVKITYSFKTNTL